MGLFVYGEYPFQRPAMQLLVKRFALALLAVNLDTQEIIQWTR